MRRDRLTFGMMVGIPLLQLMLFGFAINSDPRHMNAAVLVADNGPHGRSLLYAIRSYNLKPSRDASNPVNDTRVAVFFDQQPVIFTLRPSAPEMITVAGEKVSAQLISVSTGNQNPQLDHLQIKLWLGNDDRRLPLRISAGGFQADLVANPNTPK